jgi:hypothetical protein
MTFASGLLGRPRAALEADGPLSMKTSSRSLHRFNLFSLGAKLRSSTCHSAAGVMVRLVAPYQNTLVTTRLSRLSCLAIRRTNLLPTGVTLPKDSWELRYCHDVTLSHRYASSGSVGRHPCLWTQQLGLAKSEALDFRHRCCLNL